MRVLPYGDRALLAELETTNDALALYDSLGRQVPPGVLELVPAARTVLVRIDPGRISLGAAERWIAQSAGEGTTPPAGAEIAIDIVYDGIDLDTLAVALGLGRDALIERHLNATWRVAFIGFAPGFAYLVSDEFEFEVPRHATSRQRVPAGAVGMAGRFCGIYPRESPGGWQLIGRTAARLWDLARPDPALLAPGTVVRFEAVRS